MSTFFIATDKHGSTLVVSATETGVVFTATNKDGATAVATLSNEAARKFADVIAHDLVTK